MSLLVELNKEDLMRICMNLPVGHTYSEAEQWTNIGAARFTGNQHNENWSWNKDYFAKLSEQQLITFYHNHK